MGKKMGRPTISPAGAMGRVLQIRLTDSERSEYQRAAEKADKPLSAWIREQLDKAAKRESKRD